MENRTLRDWKLYRQLRKTLDTICSDHEADQTWLMSSTSYSPNKSFDDILEITSIEDEGIGEVVDGGQDNLLLQKINEKLELKSYFALWKDAVELSATKRRKAEFYDRYNCLEKSLKIWKNAVKDIQKKREEDKWFKAAAFDGTRLLRSYLSTWRTYSRLMKSKKELLNLEKQKEKSQAKVGEFLLNLQTLRRQIHSEMDFHPLSRKPTPVSASWKTSPWHSPKKTPKKIRKILIRDEDLITAPSSVDRLSPISYEMGCLGNGHPSAVDEAGLPLISIREAATIVADLRGKLNQTAIQRKFLMEQSYKMKEQEQELNEMARMKEQLQMGRAITNLDLYRSLIFKNPKKQSILHGLNLNVNTRKSSTSSKNTKPGGRRASTAKESNSKNSKEIEQTDISNLRGQAPIITRKKELRNIIIPQEDIIRVNREFWKYDPENCLKEYHYESDDDDSEAELKALFTDDNIENDSTKPRIETRTLDNKDQTKRTQTPEFLVQMRKRQMERAEKREEIRKVHEKKAEEKKRQAFEEETLRIQANEEQKVVRRKKFRKQKKEEKQRVQQMEIEKERIKVMTRKAKAFYMETIKKNALNRWKKLIKDRCLNEFLADKHLETFLKTKCLKDWIHMTKSNQIMRRIKAEEFEKQKLISNSFGKWVEAQMNSRRKLQSAFDFNEMRLTTVIFRNWRAVNDEESQQQLKKDFQAIRHHRKNIMKRLLHQWILYVTKREDIHSQELIRAHFQAQVQLQLPDYNPGSGFDEI